MASDTDHALIPADLFKGTIHSFRNWPDVPLQKGPPGVYTVWDTSTFLYVGISWKEPSSGSSSPGLWGRLQSHASGQRSGDQFCLYICDRFVLPELGRKELREVSAGQRSLNQMTRDFIRDRLAFRFVTTTTGKEARLIESHIRRQGMPGHGQPFLNPLNNS